MIRIEEDVLLGWLELRTNGGSVRLLLLAPESDLAIGGERRQRCSDRERRVNHEGHLARHYFAD